MPTSLCDGNPATDHGARQWIGIPATVGDRNALRQRRKALRTSLAMSRGSQTRHPEGGKVSWTDAANRRLRQATTAMASLSSPELTSCHTGEQLRHHARRATRCTQQQSRGAESSCDGESPRTTLATTVSERCALGARDSRRPSSRADWRDRRASTGSAGDGAKRVLPAERPDGTGRTTYRAELRGRSGPACGARRGPGRVSSSP